MPAVRTSLWIVPVVLSVALLAAPLRGGPQPSKAAEPSKPGSAVEVEVKYTDDSAMKLKLLDEKLELVTKHGVLRVADVRRIEFANRVPADVAEKAAVAISKLNHSDFKTREIATEELKTLRERAYPQLLKVLKHDDPEVMRRAEEIVLFIRSKVSAANLEQRDQDVIHTDDSKIAGKLSAEMLRVGTFQFGEQQLKLTDVRSLRTSGGAEELANALPGPAHLANYQNQFNKEYVFSVTAAQPNAFGNVWGQDVYTLDSNLPTAVIHAGLAKAGETVVVRVRIIASPPAFAGTVRNGVTSTVYGPYQGGAYEFVRK